MAYVFDLRGWEQERFRYGAYGEKMRGATPKTKLLAYAGIAKTPIEWVNDLQLKIPHRLLWERINRLKWSFEVAIAKPNQRLPPISYQGKIQSLAAWSRELGIKESTLRYRLSVLKLPIDSSAAKGNLKSKRTVTYRDESMTLKQLSQLSGINPRVLYTRIFRQEWSVERAVKEPVRNYVCKSRMNPL